MDEFREDWEPAADALNEAVPWRAVVWRLSEMLMFVVPRVQITSRTKMSILDIDTKGF